MLSSRLARHLRGSAGQRGDAETSATRASVARVRGQMDWPRLRLDHFGFNRAASVVRVACDEAQHEVAERERAEREGRVADHAQPTQLINQARLHELR